MNMVKKNILFLILLFLLSSFIPAGQTSNADLIKWVIVPGGSLRVEGSTNVNKFNCEIANYSRPDTITLYSNSRTKESFPLSGDLRLDVQSFDCHNPVMTGDLRKTLKAKEHPKLHIKFLTLTRLPEAQSHEPVKGLVDIRLAGVTKRFDVNYKFSREGQGLQLIGVRDIHFSDFDLTPPRKLGGMIQTDNKLKVEFRLRMKEID